MTQRYCIARFFMAAVTSMSCRIRVKVLCIAISAFSYNVHAQEEVATAPVVEVPPSPDAAHLGTYGDFNVSKATGSADVSVPIITLQEGGITIPIALSYQSAGLRVDERPSWVGMGWVLSTGGMISRTMRGRHDDIPNGFLRNSTSIPDKSRVEATLALNNTSFQSDLYVELDNITKNLDRDYEPDAFSFNFPGHSGSFFFGNDGTAHCVEHQAIKIIPTRGTVTEVGNNVIMKWTVIDESGIEYVFSALEFTDTRFLDWVSPTYVSSWYLTSIHNPITKTTANFFYDVGPYNYNYSDISHQYSYSRRPDQSVHWAGPTISSSFQETKHQKVKFLSLITLNSNHIDFYTSATTEPFRRLDRIRWKNGLSEKNFNFSYNYFESKCSNLNDAGCGRSRLLSVTEDAIGDPKVYSFEYYPGDIPKTGTYGQDHWGFYNGKNGNSNLVPNIPYAGVSGGVGGTADRSTSFANSLIGMLKKITYPTKGSTTFTYEQNTWEDEAEQADVEIVQNFGNLDVTGTQILTPTCNSTTINATNTIYNYQLTYAYRATFSGPPDRFEPYVNVVKVSTGQVIDTYVMDYPWTSQYPIAVSTVLPAGYTYRVDVCAYTGQTALINPLDLRKYDPATIGQPVARPTGGLRVSRIENNDVESGKTQTKTFTYGTGGYLVNSHLDALNGVPSYSSVSEYIKVVYDEQGGWEDTYSTYTLLAASSPVIGLTVSSVPVAYQRVQEWAGTPTDNVGRTETIFRVENDEGTGLTPQVSRHTARTMVDIENYYDKAGNLVGYVDFDYGEKIAASAIGFRVRRVRAGTHRDFLNDFDFENYRLYSSWYPLNSKKTYTVSPSGPFEETVSYTYDLSGMHTNPIQELTTNSRAEELRTTYAFPTDVITAKNNCYESFYNQLNACTANASNFVMQAVPCRAKWDACAAALGYEQSLFILDNFNDAQKFSACLNEPNGYKSCLTALGPSYTYEACQRQAFADYGVCQEVYSNSVKSEAKTKPNPVDKANALLARYHWYSAPIETKAFKGTQELTRNNFIYSYSSDTIPMKSAVIVTHRGIEKDSVVAIRKYDVNANPTEILDYKDGLIKSYLWGYGNTKLIAEFSNARLTDVAHSSFESGSNEGNLTFVLVPDAQARTGTGSHKLVGNPITKNGLTAGTRYKVSYWAKSGIPAVNGVLTSYSGLAEFEGWTYHEKIVSNVTTITITGSYLTLIDELRIAPESAMVSTFVHKPGIGVSSATDPNNRTTFYQYDLQGRLISVQDHYHDLLRVLQYNFRDQ